MPPGPEPSGPPARSPTGTCRRACRRSSRARPRPRRRSPRSRAGCHLHRGRNRSGSSRSARPDVAHGTVPASVPSTLPRLGPVRAVRSPRRKHTVPRKLRPVVSCCQARRRCRDPHRAGERAVALPQLGSRRGVAGQEEEQPVVDQEVVRERRGPCPARCPSPAACRLERAVALPELRALVRCVARREVTRSCPAPRARCPRSRRRAGAYVADQCRARVRAVGAQQLEAGARVLRAEVEEAAHHRREARERAGRTGVDVLDQRRAARCVRRSSQARCRCWGRSPRGRRSCRAFRTGSPATSSGPG